MSGIKIAGAGFFVPGKTVTNDELSAIVDTNDEWIYSRSGIRTRHMVTEGEGVETMAMAAVEKAIKNAQENDPDFSKDKIRAVFTATMTADLLLPSVSCLIQKEMGLEKDIKAFDICAACTSFVYALQTGYAQLNLMEEGYVLLVGAECMSRILDMTDRSTCVLFGDGAGAVIIKKDASENGMYLELCGTEGNPEVLRCGSGRSKERFVYMEGQKVYRFATTALNNAIKKLLEKSGHSLDDIDYVVCHQANARIIDAVKRKYPGHEHKFFTDVEAYANTSSASVGIAMADMWERKLLKPGMRIITAAFGAGLSWNAVMMTI